MREWGEGHSIVADSYSTMRCVVGEIRSIFQLVLARRRIRVSFAHVYIFDSQGYNIMVTDGFPGIVEFDVLDFYTGEFVYETRY